MREEPLFRTRCVIEGCDNEGTHVIGVRLRKPNFNLAAWAPNSAAHLCDGHAAVGMRVEVALKPIELPEVEVRVWCDGGWMTRRVLLRDATEE